MRNCYPAWFVEFWSILLFCTHLTRIITLARTSNIKELCICEEFCLLLLKINRRRRKKKTSLKVPLSHIYFFCNLNLSKQSKNGGKSLKNMFDYNCFYNTSTDYNCWLNIPRDPRSEIFNSRNIPHNLSSKNNC